MTRRRSALLKLFCLTGGLSAAAWWFAGHRSMAAEARRHWREGVEAVKEGDFVRARAAWKGCLAARSDEEDCAAGMALLEREDALLAKASKPEAAPAEPAGPGTAPGAAVGTGDRDRELSRAIKLLDEGRYEEAYTLAKKNLERNPGDLSARAVIMLARGRGAGASAPKPAAAPSEASEDEKRRAVKHWNEGIKYFQRADYAKARDEWLLCQKFNPGNEDCAVGLKRIETTVGGQP